MSLLISILIIIWDIFILVFEGTPGIEIVEEIVEILYVFLSTIFVSEFGDRLGARESAFGFEDGGPEFVVFSFFELFLGGRFDVGVLVDGIVLSTLDGVEEDFGGFLDAFEETVVFRAAGCCFFVGVMAENLFAVGTFDLFFCGFEAVFGET